MEPQPLAQKAQEKTKKGKGVHQGTITEESRATSKGRETK